MTGDAAPVHITVYTIIKPVLEFPGALSQNLHRSFVISVAVDHGGRSKLNPIDGRLRRASDRC